MTKYTYVTISPELSEFLNMFSGITMKPSAIYRLTEAELATFSIMKSHYIVMEAYPNTSPSPDSDVNSMMSEDTTEHTVYVMVSKELSECLDLDADAIYPRINLWDALKTHCTEVVFHPKKSLPPPPPPLPVPFEKVETTKLEFTTHVAIDEELSAFLGLDVNTFYHRDMIFKQMNQYILDNKCAEPRCRDIFPNAPLSKLLRLEPGDKLDYFILGSKVKAHFTKGANL